MKSFLFGVIAVSTVLLGGCARSDEAENSANSDHRVNVAVSLYPLAFMAQQIGGDAVDVTNIVGGSDPHDYRLSPRDIAVLNRADIAIIFGASLEPWGDDIAQQRMDAHKNTVRISDHIALHETEENYGEEHGEKHSGKEGHHYDPHAWTDPVLAQDIVRTIAQTLQDADAQNASYYQENATALIAKFHALDRAYREGLASCAMRGVIVSHDAFGYIARRYNIQTYAIAGLSTQDEPSAHILAQLKAHARSGDAQFILAEKNSVQRFAQTLARETGLEMLSIDAIGSGTLNSSDDYFARAYANLATIRKALNCQ